MSDYREHLAQFKRDMDNPPPAQKEPDPSDWEWTPEQVASYEAWASSQTPATLSQMLQDWQAGHDQDFPAVFEAEERARAKQYANEHGLALTLEYISRLERIALASVALLKFDMVYLMRNPSEGEKQKELYEALRAVKLFEDEGL